MLFSILAVATAHASDFSWAYVGNIPDTTDIAVCPDGTLIALTTSSAGQPLVRSTTSVLTSGLGSTNTWITWGGGVDHISCGGSGGAMALQSLSSSGWIGTFLYPSSYGYSYGTYTYAPDAEDIKALSIDEIVVHNFDRYDYRGNRNYGTNTFDFTYLGDMWGAREIAATQYAASNSGEVAFALNDGWASDYSLWANFPQWSFDLDFDLSWSQLPLSSFNVAIAEVGTDAEAVRTPSGTYLFVLVPGGDVYRGTVIP